jgi:transcriptional regulator with XRE-family HTH domain
MTSGGISFDIRRMRKARGMSLKRLASLAGTSVPTMSRYESGWSRFELSTLRKLATALGCRLEISWQPLVNRKSLQTEAQLIDRLGRLFWDRRIEQGDTQRYPRWLVGRVIQYGKIEDIRALSSFLGRKRFLQIVSGLRMPTTKLERFWETMLRYEGMTCTKKPSPAQAASSWPA